MDSGREIDTEDLADWQLYNEVPIHDGDSWKVKEIADAISWENEFKCVESGETRKLYHYEKGIWKPNGETVVESEALRITNELLRPNNINQVTRIIKNRNRVPKDEFKMRDFIIPFGNGVYDLKRQQFDEHRPKHNLKYKHNVSYLKTEEDVNEENYRKTHRKQSTNASEDSDLYESKAEEFIDSLVDTERKKSILKETIGLALMSNYPIQEAPVLYGKGNNGKNMFVKMLKEMSGMWHSIDLGEFSDDQFAKKEMEDSSFVFFDEIGHISDPNKLKSFIGEEDMRIRPMRDTGYMGKQRAIPIMAGNEIPTPPEQTDGFHRRFCIIDFPYKFTEGDDGYKDQIPKAEIEAEYMNLFELSKLATQIVEELPPVLEQEGFTQSYSTDIKRQVWNMKSSIVYTFLDMFVEQGELPNQSTTSEADSIRKDKLLEMCNDFVEKLNGTQVRSHELQQAIKNSPNLETGTDKRVELEDGSETRAHSGLRLVAPSFQDFRGVADLRDAGSFLLLQYSSMFEALSGKQVLSTLEVAESELEAKTIRFIKESDQTTISLLSIIKGLDLDQSDVRKILESDFINRHHSSDLQFAYPKLSIDQEAFDQAVEESDIVIEESEELKRPYDWLKEQADSWSKETVKDKSDLIDNGVDKGFSQEKLEDGLEELISDGEIYEPKPNKVQKL